MIRIITEEKAKRKERTCELCRQAHAGHPEAWMWAEYEVWTKKAFSTAENRWVYLCRECALNGWDAKTEREVRELERRSITELDLDEEV